MNEKAHWDRIAPGYDQEIFDVFQSDKNKILPGYFKKHGNKAHRAIDFGCGIGKAFPFLCPLFEEVVAIDISSECLTGARARAFENVRYQQADLTKTNVKFPAADFVLSCNVIMLPEIEKNRAMFQNVHKALRSGGTALMVVPSLESIFYSAWRLLEWYRKEGVKPEVVPDEELKYFSASKRRIIDGIMHIDGVPTKHYSEPELRVVLEECELHVTAIERLEYNWDTEFPEPPAWMKAPYPWDWLIECKK
ncbi:MAG: class I SAM-dependent methyltransferase [Cytophagales bacterium]|nr:class I SAM-dependent methyltransferase [Cytophagales bacterium]